MGDPPSTVDAATNIGLWPNRPTLVVRAYRRLDCAPERCASTQLETMNAVRSTGITRQRRVEDVGDPPPASKLMPRPLFTLPGYN